MLQDDVIHPYPGLRPFREDETHLYFGREQHRGELLKRLGLTRFVAVIGTSGSGKSSLVRAGLLPDLLSGYLPGTGSDWVIAETKPGADPLGHLAEALTGVGLKTDATALRTNSSEILDLARNGLQPGQHLLVLVDQFEELFRLKVSDDPAMDADEKAAFVRLLLNAGGQRADSAGTSAPVHVVMAMRSEFLGRASMYRGLPEAIDQGQYLIPRLTREQLRKAIESPAHVAGSDIHAGLLQRLLNDLGDDQDQLPVLQHALMRCWLLRTSDDLLDLETYERSGQLAQALSVDANEAAAEAYQALGSRGKTTVMRVFQALRETDVHGGQTRRPTTAADLCELAACTMEDLERSVAPFRQRSFVLPAPEVDLTPTTLLDISHEALLRRWDALRGWILQDDLDRGRYVRLATRAAEEQGSASPQYLRPPFLDLMVTFWGDRKPPRAWGLRHHSGFDQANLFLEASTKHHRDQQEAEAERQEEEGRRRQAQLEEEARSERASAIEGVRRRNLITLVLTVAAMTVVIATAVALSWWNAIAQRDRMRSLVLQARAASLPEGETVAKLHLTSLAAQQLKDADSRSDLLTALLIAPLPQPENWGAGLPSSIDAVAVSSQLGRVYVAADGRLRSLDLASGKEVSSIPLNQLPPYTERSVTHLLMVGDKLLVSAGTFNVVDARTLQPIGGPIGDSQAFTTSASGTTAAFLLDEQLALCDITTGCQELRRHKLVTQGSEPAVAPTDLELSGSGSSLVAIENDDDTGRIALFDTSPWRQRAVKRIGGAGRKLAIGVTPSYVYLCTNRSLVRYDAFDDSLDSQSISEFRPEATACRVSNGKTVSLHADGAVRVWDEAGTLIAVASTGEASTMMALDGTALVTVGDHAHVWDITPYGRSSAARLRGFAGGMAYGVDGESVALDSGVVSTNGPRLALDILNTSAPRLPRRRPGNIPRRRGLLPTSVSDSGRTALYVVDSQLIAAALRPGESPVEKARYQVTDIISAATGAVYSSGRLPPHVVHTRVSPDDHFAAVTLRTDDLAEEGDRVIVLNLDVKDTTTAVVRTLDSKVSAAFFAPGGKLLTFSQAQRTATPEIGIAQLDAAGAPRVFRRLAKNTRPTTAVFSADGRSLALAVSDGNSSTVQLFDWPVSSSAEVSPRMTLFHPSSVTTLALTADGRGLLTSTPVVTSVWDTKTGKATLKIPVRGDEGTVATYTPAGRIAFLDDVGGLTILPSDPDELWTEACRRLTRNLWKEDEWQAFVGTDIEYQPACPALPMSRPAPARAGNESSANATATGAASR